METTRATATKARDLVAAGHVHVIVPHVLFSVLNLDRTAAYLVARTPLGTDTMPDRHTGPVAPATSCTCPAVGACSHLAAAHLVTLRAELDAAGDPFAGITPDAEVDR